MTRWRQAISTIWNNEVYKKLINFIHVNEPDIIHIHNTFPLGSPAIISAVQKENIPLVMTLHNYRLLCLNAIFYRQGFVCEDCLGHYPWRGILHECYRKRPESAVVACMICFHRLIKTWDHVDRFIALTKFSHDKFVEAGIASEKIDIRPNFIFPDPGCRTAKGKYALFIGRLSSEKGSKTLLNAWAHLDSDIPLKIVGDGMLKGDIYSIIPNMKNVALLGKLTSEEIYSLMEEASFLIFPSEWYEGMPRVLLEAFAKGLPVITSDIGSQKTIVKSGLTGLYFEAGDYVDLTRKAIWAFEHPDAMTAMGKAARREYEEKYTAEKNYTILMEIYSKAISYHRNH